MDNRSPFVSEDFQEFLKRNSLNTSSVAFPPALEEAATHFELIPKKILEVRQEPSPLFDPLAYESIFLTPFRLTTPYHRIIEK